MSEPRELPDELHSDELESLENWFSGACDVPAVTDSARLKRNIRVAVHEAWVGGELSSSAGAFHGERIKLAVRAELSHMREIPSSRFKLIARGKWIAGGVAIAAALTLAVFGARWFESTITERDTVEWLEIATDFSTDEWDEEFSVIEDQLDGLDDAMASGWIIDEEVDELSNGT